ncbi:MAG: triose-phosphate isomerase [Candidatus Magasanikbacteria bacterium]|nr:triose-phosphate isomerase [Candidatus Magasanikbacteria bacterium]
MTMKESFELAQRISDLHFFEDVEVVLCPNTLAFSGVKEKAGQAVKLGAQDCLWVPQGAYTGATSAFMFREAGASYALVGHSERRYLFGETNEDIRKKMEACADNGLTPVLCVGETAEDREEGKTEYRIKKQLLKAFEGLHFERVRPIIAYEPVWAISKSGLGEPCDPAQANAMHEFIKREMKEHLGEPIRVIYGGSVNAENVKFFSSQASIDGVLVGSASTRFDSFSKILEALSEKN